MPLRSCRHTARRASSATWDEGPRLFSLPISINLDTALAGPPQAVWTRTTHTSNHMSKKAKIICIYLAIGVLFALYGWLFGDNSYKSFAYNLGTGIVWPIMLFPGLGKILGAGILALFVGLVLMS